VRNQIYIKEKTIPLSFKYSKTSFEKNNQGKSSTGLTDNSAL
jgi:hypothetical protein